MAQTDTPEYRFILAGEQRAGATYTVACPYDGAPVGMVHRAGPDDAGAGDSGRRRGVRDDAQAARPQARGGAA